MAPSPIIDALLYSSLHAVLALTTLFGYYGMAEAKTNWREIGAFAAAAIVGFVFAIVIQIKFLGQILVPGLALICYSATLSVLFSAAPRIIQKNRQASISSLFRLTMYTAVVTVLGKTADQQFIWSFTIWILCLTLAFYFLLASDHLKTPGIRLAAFSICGVYFFLLFPIWQMTSSTIGTLSGAFSEWQRTLFDSPGNSLMSCLGA